MLPFGLSTIPAYFQRLMDMVLNELDIKNKRVFVYIDDVLVATDTLERHMEVLQLVFHAFQKAHLRLKPQKCQLFKRKIAFLDHVIDENGVIPTQIRSQRFSRTLCHEILPS